MISTLEIIDIISGRLKTSALKAEAKGGLYKMGERPVGSNKEDTVVNCLPTSGAQLQTATVNVNTYVPDSELTIEGTAQYKAKYARLKTLAALAIQDLKEVATDQYHFRIVSQGVIEEEETHQHFINTRIEFKTFNL